MRVSRLALSAFAVLAFAAISVAAVNEPADGTANPDGMCMLKSLGFTGLSIVKKANGQPGFADNYFHYTCTCDSSFAGTALVPRTYDWSSSVDVTFNGVVVHHRKNYNAISNDGTARTGGELKSPLTQSSFLAFVTGQNTIVLGVSCNTLADPDCYYRYTITCNKPPAQGGSVVGDPQFVGLRGQSYQVHGVDGEIYNIVSDSDLQYNSRFVFLNKGKCPVIDGRKQKACWSHPGSYLGELGLKTRAGDKIRLLSGSADLGFAAVTVNGKELAVGDSVLLADNLGSVSRNSTHLASVTVGNWDFAFENSDAFVNQRVRVLDSRGLRSHGLLGQTWRETTYPNAIKFVQGQVDDYVIRDSDIFGDNFVFNAFN